MKSVFTTSDVPATQRVDLWQTTVTDTFAPVAIENFQPDGFNAQIETVRLGDLEVSHFTGVEQGISRPRRIIRSSDADMFVAVVIMSGRLSYAHGHKEAVLAGPGITLFDMTQEYQTMFHDRMDFLDVSVPRHRVEALLGPTRNLVGMTLGPEEPMTQIITEFFRNQVTVADRLGAESACRLGGIGADLLTAGFLEKMGSSPSQSPTAAAYLVRAKAFIRANLANENLSAEAVAHSQNLSLRRMQEIFAGEMLSISDYVWEQRLRRAKGLLEDKAFGNRPIADIAFAAGFSSLPHFSRRFRARFGCTPIECRMQVRVGTPA